MLIIIEWPPRLNLAPCPLGMPLALPLGRLLKNPCGCFEQTEVIGPSSITGRTADEPIRADEEGQDGHSDHQTSDRESHAGQSHGPAHLHSELPILDTNPRVARYWIIPRLSVRANYNGGVTPSGEGGSGSIGSQG
jgi:hypothetical protein